MRKKAAEVADKIKTEVSKAGEAVQAAIAISVVALLLAVVAIVIGVRPRHA